MISFRIPLVWQMYGHVDVEADTLDDAIEYALGPDCPLPETVVLACVEYDPDKDLLQTVVYGDCASDEPTAIVEHYNTDFEE